MMKYLVALAVVIGAGFYLIDSDNTAMQKCQEKYSYGTCRTILR